MGIFTNARAFLFRRRRFLQLLVSGVTGLFFLSKSGKGGIFAQELANPSTNDEPKPSPELDWKVEFLRAYGLKENEVLKRVAPPFPACRADYCRFLKANYCSWMESDNVSMSYRFDGKDVTFWSLTPDPNGVELPTLLADLGIPAQEVEIDEDLRFKQIPGEFVVRTGAPVEKSVPRLEQMLREELHLPIRLTLKQLEREVIVVRGKYESKPRANRKVNQVDLFAIKPNEDGGSAGGRGTFDKFLEWVGTWIDRRFVNDLGNTPKGEMMWFFHPSRLMHSGSDPNKDADGVLKNITAQTGLTFRTEKRNKVRVLLVKSE